MLNPSDKSLVQRTLAGKRDAFGVLVERYLTLVRGLVFEKIRQRDEVDDVVQESFSKAYQELSHLRIRVSPQAAGGGAAAISRREAGIRGDGNPHVFLRGSLARMGYSRGRCRGQIMPSHEWARGSASSFLRQWPAWVAHVI